MSFKTADLCDEFQDEVQILLPGLRDFGARRRFHGEIVTIDAQGDFSRVREQVRSPGAGKVLVIDNNACQRSAMLGDRLAAAALENDWQGVVINGCIRDSADIAGMGLGVKALACIPARGMLAGQGVSGSILRFMGAEFRPGEFIYCDEDGVLLCARALI